MTGEEKPGEEVPAEFEGVDTEGFTKDELEALLEGDTTDGQPEKETEKSDDIQADKKPEKEPEHPKGYVPLKALQEARTKLKGKETEIGELHKWQADLASKLADHRTAPEAEPEQQPIDPNEDPMGFIADLGKQVQDMRADSQKGAEEQQQMQARHHQEEQVIGGFIGYREELVSGDPDTAKALDFAIEKQGAAFRANGLNGQALNNAMRHEIIRQANIVGSLPEDMRKQHILGTARYFGFEAGSEPAKESAKDKIDKLEAIQSATKTLSGGGAAGAEMTLEDVENMTGAELDKIALKDPEFFARLGLGD